MYEELKTILDEASMRTTKPRMQVFSLLKEAQSPMSIAEIVKRLTDIDKVSVYRTVALFKELGIVSIITNGWSYKYELASPMKPHHHHLVCSLCHDVIEIKSDHLESIIENVTAENNFFPTSHHFEIIGLCETCSRKRVS